LSHTLLFGVAIPTVGSGARKVGFPVSSPAGGEAGAIYRKSRFTGSRLQVRKESPSSHSFPHDFVAAADAEPQNGCLTRLLGVAFEETTS
jgi:hypothetical protein